jgi:hypothetical protein
MQTRRWTNPNQPQTLYIAVFLLYLDAAFGIFRMLAFGVFPLVPLALAAGGVAAGFGIANEKKWGYFLGIAMAFLPLTLRIIFLGPGDAFSVGLLNLMFEIALIALLLHPQSREYQRVWFQ